MNDTSVQKLLEADIASLAARASNPRATLTALSQRVVAALGEVDAALAEADGRAMDLPVALEAERQKFARLEAVIANARQDGRADLEEAAVARRSTLAARVAELEAEVEAVDARAMTLQDLRARLEGRQAELVAAIAAAPPSSAAAHGGPASQVTTAPGDRAPVSRPPSSGSAPGSAAAPPSTLGASAAASPSKGGGDALDDAFAALLAAENISLSDVKLPPRKSAAPPPPAVTDDLGLPDLVVVRDDALPDDATEEDRAPIPTVPKKGAAPASAKGAAPPASRPPSASAASAPPGPTTARARPASPAPAQEGPPAPQGGKSRAALWLSLLVLIGGAGAAYAHFVLKRF
jgi:hypothetical protein